MQASTTNVTDAESTKFGSMTFVHEPRQCPFDRGPPAGLTGYRTSAAAARTGFDPLQPHRYAYGVQQSPGQPRRSKILDRLRVSHVIS